MKKILIILIVLFIISLLTGCGIQDKDEIIKIYRDNEKVFIEAASTGDFTKVEKIHGVEKIYKLDNYTSISFGGSGMGGNTNYYYIRYMKEECCGDFKVDDEFKKHGNGYIYNEKEYNKGGDNVFYFEDLGNNYYYIEEHF